MSEPCYFCGKNKPVAFSLRDEKGKDHPVCKDCGDEWAESDQEWPPKNNKNESNSPISLTVNVST